MAEHAGFCLSALGDFSLARQILIQNTHLVLHIKVFLRKCPIALAEAIKLCSERTDFLQDGCVPLLGIGEPVLLQLDAALIFLDGKDPSVEFKVLVGKALLVGLFE